MQTEASSPMGFVQRRLPWIIAAGALVVYLLTLSRWITFSGLGVLSEVLGWDWHPPMFSPLHFLLTYPIRWLPTGWQVLTLNLFSAVCQVLTLAVLARSVAIFPHDRTRDQRALERSEYSFLSLRSAWLPPLLAVLVCGLQMTFWENAVVGMGESLDLLLFAYCIRCLLEYRTAQQESWLTRLALVYGLATANNFAMIALWPAFLVALIWIMGWRFFNGRFVLKMLGFGGLGLLLYLLLPAINSASNITGRGFFEMLRAYWYYQLNTIWEFPRFIIFIIAFTSVVPVLFISIRWPAQYGDISAAGNLVANLTMHILHGFFLVACIWVMFDPLFSPRSLGQKWGQPWAFLSFYYLSALTVGYCSGYFLLVFGGGLVRPWQRPSLVEQWLNKVIVAAVWIGLIAVPITLVYRNLPQVQVNQAPFLRQFGLAAARCLPPQGAIILSDDHPRLYALAAALYQSGVQDKYVLLDTQSLNQPIYHRYLRHAYGDRWPKLSREPRTLREQVEPASIVQLLMDLVRANEVYYLHPSFGYYFERFSLKPHSLVYRLQLAPTNTVEDPLPTAAEFKANDEFWKRLRHEELGPLRKALWTKDPKKLPNYAVFVVGAMYSRALDFLGVEYQRAGDLPQAAEYFAAALELNTNNPAAYLNLEYNRLLQAGRRENPKPSSGLGERLALFRNSLELSLSYNGPFDEPNMCYSLGLLHAGANCSRQAAQQFLRAVSLDTNYYAARFDLAKVYVQLHGYDVALQEIAILRAQAAAKPELPLNPVALIEVEALAHFNNNDFPTAEKLLLEAQQKYPSQASPFVTLSRLYASRLDFTNALAVLAKQIRIQTNNASALLEYSVLKMQLKDAAGALPFLNRALALSPQNQVVLMNRALAYLQTTNFVAAQRDYETLLRILDRPPHWVYFGLGEVFYQKNDRPKALKNYEDFLKAAPPGTPEIKRVQDRIKQIKSGTL